MMETTCTKSRAFFQALEATQLIVHAVLGVVCMVAIGAPQANHQTHLAVTVPNEALYGLKTIITPPCVHCAGMDNYTG